MPHGRYITLDPGDIVLDGDPRPKKPRHSSRQFSARVYCGETVTHLTHLLSICSTESEILSPHHSTAYTVCRCGHLLPTELRGLSVALSVCPSVGLTH